MKSRKTRHVLRLLKRDWEADFGEMVELAWFAGHSRGTAPLVEEKRLVNSIMVFRRHRTSKHKAYSAYAVSNVV